MGVPDAGFVSQTIDGRHGVGNRFVAIPFLVGDDEEVFFGRASLRHERRAKGRAERHSRSNTDSSYHKFSGRLQLLATSAFLRFGGDKSFSGLLASNTRLKNPTIISSQLWSPQTMS